MLETREQQRKSSLNPAVGLWRCWHCYIRSIVYWGDKKTDVCCLKPPSLWHFVIGALYGNTDTMKIPRQILCLKAPLNSSLSLRRKFSNVKKPENWGSEAQNILIRQSSRVREETAVDSSSLGNSKMTNIHAKKEHRSQVSFESQLLCPCILCISNIKCKSNN